MKNVSHFLAGFAVTLAVGVPGLVLYSRPASDKAVTIPPKISSSEMIADQSIIDESPARENAERASTITAVNNNEYERYASSLLAESDSKTVTSPNQSTGQWTTNDPDVGADRSIGPVPSEVNSGEYAAPYPNELLGMASSGSSSTSASAKSGGTQTSTPASPAVADTTGPDPGNEPIVYPPRRIPWHQGFTLEQEWYRAWYGWGAVADAQAADGKSGN